MQDTTHSETKENEDAELKETSGKRENSMNRQGEGKSGELGSCTRCGRFGHKPEDCLKPVVGNRCSKEGHLQRVYSETMPWEYVAPFCGFAAHGQGFHIIQEDDCGDREKDMANCALITITKGEVISKQIENEFKAQAGPQSTWRWFAKKIAENVYQLRFPTAKKVEELSFFSGMQMRTVPEVFFKVEKWNSNAGAKSEIDSAWFRIFGIPLEKRSVKRVSLIGSLVGIPLEVDTINLKRWEFVRVKI